VKLLAIAAATPSRFAPMRQEAGQQALMIQIAHTDRRAIGGGEYPSHGLSTGALAATKCVVSRLTTINPFSRP